MTKAEWAKSIVEETDQELAEHSDYAQAYAALKESILSQPKYDHKWEGRYKKRREDHIDILIQSFSNYNFEA